MLEELLAQLLPPEALALLAPAARDRDFARQAFDARAATCTVLSEQLAAGVWTGRAVAAAVTAAASDRLLLRMSCGKYIAAHGGQTDLDIEYRPLLPPGQTISLEDIMTALAFTATARPDATPELWFASLQDEARGYLHQLCADVYLAAASARLDSLDAQLMARLDPADPYAARNILLHSAAVALFREFRLPWRVAVAYRRFSAAFPDDPLAGWHARADADPDYRDATLNAYYSLVLNALAALCLRNPRDRREIERLETELPPPDFAPALGLYEPDVVALPDLPPAVFAAAVAGLGQIGKALKLACASSPARRISRAVVVLAAWEAFALRGLGDFRQLASRLRQSHPDTTADALGVVVGALRGEALYRLGRYEDAYLDLLGAEDAARAALARGRGSRPVDWHASERDAIARLAQKAGNALAAIGDEAAAGVAYARAAELATGPLARAGNFVNEGNRHFLRNSAVGGQGYITLDAEARQEFALRGPERLIAAVRGQHVHSLQRAAAAYWAGLDALAGVDATVPGVLALTAACHINLGNIAWAWGQTLVKEGTSRLRDLPLGPDFASQLLPVGADALACYEAAVQQYAAALDYLPLPASHREVITALSSSSEMRYLIAREHRRTLATESIEGAEAPCPVQAPLGLSERTSAPAVAKKASESLARGLEEAGRCLVLIRQDDAALYPDLVWRTHYNLARMFRLLDEPARAEEHFHAAMEVVERLRGALRLGAHQATFLHDKHDVYEGYIDLLLSAVTAGAADVGEEKRASHPLPKASALSVNSMAKKPADNLPLIFELFERSRAAAFRALLQAAHVRPELPGALRKEVEDLLARVSACNEAIQAAIAADRPDETAALLDEQTRLARLWVDVQAKMARQQARQQQRPGQSSSPVAALAEFQAALAADQAYLGLLLGDEASFALLIDRTSARAFRLPPRRALELLALPVLAYATWSNAETAAAFRAANVALTDALLGPLDEAVGGLATWLQGKHLLISPDGILCYLPFDMLLADRAGVAALPETADFPDFAPCYLLSLADLSYIASASAWLELGRRPRQPNRSALLAVYNVLYNTPEPPLWAVAQQIMLKLGAVTSGPDMQRLAEAVRKAWGAAAAGADSTIVRLRGRTDEGTVEDDAHQSTERNFLAVAPAAAARIILFHGHGIYNDRYPSLSGLVFNLTPSDSPSPGRGQERGSQRGEVRAAIPTAEDGFLRVEELFQLELPGAELTLLAACQTALGAYRRGEGLNALVAGFLRRGSPAVMATLWEVRADMTAFLLRVFFRLLAEQPHVDRARLFCQAKRKAMPYVANLHLPYFWAPFVLWGYTKAATDYTDLHELDELDQSRTTSNSENS